MKLLNWIRERIPFPQFTLAHLILWTSMSCLVFAFIGLEGALFLLFLLPPAALMVTWVQRLCRNDRRNQIQWRIREATKTKEVELLESDVTGIAALVLDALDKTPVIHVGTAKQDLPDATANSVANSVADEAVVLSEGRLPHSIAILIVRDVLVSIQD